MRSAPRLNGLAASCLIGRRSKPDSRSSAYCAQLIDLPNSPSLTTSMPACACSRTTSATDVCQAFLIGIFVIRLARLLAAQEFLQAARTDQAADMRRENAICAAFHAALYARRARERNA